MVSKKTSSTLAKNYLKSELIRRGITTEDLAKRLQECWVFETKASIDNKISRGTFSAIFMLQCLEAIGCSKIEIEQGIRPNIGDVRQEEVIYTNKKTWTRYISINTESNSMDERRAVISLFSGAGWLDIGLEQAGFETSVCVEYDADCRSTLKHNRPSWIVFDSAEKVVKGKKVHRIPWDVRSIDPKELLDAWNLKKWDVALMVWWAPCQPFSNIGKKRWKEDPKNGDLFLEFVRMVKGILPKAFIFENVTWITHSKHSDVIDYMIAQFKWLGYGISYSILNSANYWVPQKRERFFLVWIQWVENPAFPLPTHIKDKKTWDSFIRELDPALTLVPRTWVSVEEAFGRISKSATKRPDYAIMKLSDKVVNRMKYVRQGTNFKAIPEELRPDCWRNGKHQGSDTFGRLVSSQPSVTIRTGAYNPSKGRYIHPIEDRWLNTIELSVLQDFPNDWIFQSSKWKPTLTGTGKQIGNAVPCGLAKAIWLAIQKQIP